MQISKIAGIVKVRYIIAALLLIIAIIVLPSIYREKKENIITRSILYISPNASYSSIIDSITTMVEDISSFLKVADKNNLPQTFKPGRYEFEKGTKNIDIVRYIQNGWQTPMMLTLSGNIRNIEKLATILGKKLALDSANFMDKFNDTTIYSTYKLTKETFPTLFIPNTYQVYWTITPTEFLDRMKTENDKFWNKIREEKARSLGLNRTQVSILASIVCEESNYKPELSTIAGVYLNRLRRGMKLDADPTVKFALGDPTIKRILFKHLEIDSPYNTYKNQGLPPGPITIPSIDGIEAVLNSKEHNYLYFCADASLNGTHNFASTLSKHNANARAYQAAINRLPRN